MSKYTDKQFEDIIMPWWDNLSINKKEELTIKYFPRFSVSMMDGYEIEEVFEKSKDTFNKTKTKMSKEEVVEMLVYFAKWESEMFYKYMDDDDGGKGAFTEFVENYLKLDKHE